MASKVSASASLGSSLPPPPNTVSHAASKISVAGPQAASPQSLIPPAPPRRMPQAPTPQAPAPQASVQKRRTGTATPVPDRPGMRNGAAEPSPVRAMEKHRRPGSLERSSRCGVEVMPEKAVGPAEDSAAEEPVPEPQVPQRSAEELQRRCDVQRTLLETQAAALMHEEQRRSQAESKLKALTDEVSSVRWLGVATERAQLQAEVEMLQHEHSAAELRAESLMELTPKRGTGTPLTYSPASNSACSGYANSDASSMPLHRRPGLQDQVASELQQC